MTWNLSDFPASISHLTPLTRKKALVIANTLMAQGFQEKLALSIATSQAKQWYREATVQERRRFDQPTAPVQSEPRPPKASRRGAAIAVKPDPAGWVVVSRNSDRATEFFQRKTDAVERAKTIASAEQDSVAIYKRNGALQQVVKPR